MTSENIKARIDFGEARDAANEGRMHEFFL